MAIGSGQCDAVAVGAQRAYVIAPPTLFLARRETSSMRVQARSFVIALATLASSAAAQTTVSPQGKTPPKANDPIYAEGYIRPPEAIAKLVDAPRESNFTWGSP